MRSESSTAARLLVAGIAIGCLVLLGCGSGSKAGAKPTATGIVGTQTPTATATRSAPVGARAVITSVGRQRFLGFGTAVASDSVFDPWAQTSGLSAQQVSQLDALTLRAGIRLVRIFGPGQFQGGTGLTEQWTAQDARLRFMRRLRGRGVRFIFTGQGAPAAMVQGGGVTGPLLPGSERAYGRFLAAALAVAARAGAPFAYAAVGNEVDNAADAGVSLTPEQTAVATRVLAREIRRRGLRTQVALGDNTTWTKSLEYARAQVGALGRQRAGIVATHSYGGEEQRPHVARFARSRRLPLWMTEWVSACPAGDCPDDPSIGFALRWAKQITTDLTVGGAAAWFMFRGVSDASHGLDGAIVVRDRNRPDSPLSKTKRYPIVRQFATAGPPGSLRVDARVTGAPDVRALAFTRPDSRALVLTHTGSEAINLQAVLGRPGTVQGWRTSASEDFRPFVDRRIESGHLTLSLPAQSVTTLVLR